LGSFYFYIIPKPYPSVFMSDLSSKTPNSIILEQERDFGSKISACFAFIGETFRPFFKSILYFISPIALIAGICGGLYQSKVMDFTSNPTIDSTSPSTSLGKNPLMMVLETMNSKGIGLTSPQYLLMLFFTILGSIAITVLSFAAMKVYRRDGSISVDSTWETFKEIFGRTFLSYLINSILIVTLIVIGGFFGFILVNSIGSTAGKIFTGFVIFMIIFIPIMYLSVVFSLSPFIAAIEGKSPLESNRRAFFLIKDKWWSTFGLIMVLAVIASFMGSIFSIPAAIIPLLRTLKVISSASLANVLIIIATILSVFGTLTLSSLGHFGIGFQYFNLVERKEGTGLLQQISTIGTVLKSSEEEDEY
jgi:hypothetical protein